MKSLKKSAKAARNGTKNKKFEFYEFFAGAGMARLGLQKHWKCVWANDNDPRKISLYRHNFGKRHIDPRDVAVVMQKLEEGDTAASEGIPAFPSKAAQMAWASFPCQDLSLAGWQRGMSAERSGTYWPFWKIMRTLRKEERGPPVIVIENVRGLLYGSNFRGLCESFAALDMQFGAFLADAKSFLPQSRPRVFLIAVDPRINLDGLTLNNPPENPWFPRAVTEAYGALPEELKDLWLWWNIGPQANRHISILDIFEESPADVEFHTDEQTQYLLSLMTPLHREKVNAAGKAGGLQVGFLYKRTRNGKQKAEVRFDGLAGCLRTPKGGSSRQTVMVVTNDEVQTRLLSRIEAARLMGISLNAKGQRPRASKCFFPDNFSYNDSYMAMGDGVAVPVVEHLASMLLDKLAERSVCIGPSGAHSMSDENQFLERVDQHVAAWIASGRE